MMTDDQITTLIPTKDEAVHVKRCVESARPLGRVVVVDSGSTDETAQLAARAGAEVFFHPWAGYAEQKNWALANTEIETPWILLLDADEFLTMNTRDAISRAILTPAVAGYWLPRRYVFLGREMRFAWWYPDYQLRLVRAGTAEFEPRSVHEHLVVDGTVERLSTADIWHENLKGLGAFVDRHNHYAALEASELLESSEGIREGNLFGDYAARRRALKLRVWMRLRGRPLVRFVWLYFIRQGFRDGREGFYYCALIAWYDLLTNAKFFERQIAASDPPNYDTAAPHPRSRTKRLIRLRPSRRRPETGRSMIWTSRWLSLKIEVRSAARRLGIVTVLQRFRRGGYEDRFRSALEDAIAAGDRVWDVGANVGLYTNLFSEWVGPEGEVVAFEPAPTAHLELQRRLSDRPNVRSLMVALGEGRGIVPFHVSDEGTTNSLLSRPGSAVVDVEIDSGDALRRDHHLSQPDVIKIDVEGYEREALHGLSETLPGCRAVLCEIHFGLLESRGSKQAPREVERYLRDLGFRTSWIDSSHLGAYRSS